jgi:hypothetical protein
LDNKDGKTLIKRSVGAVITVRHYFSLTFKPKIMGKYKDNGNAALALAEECAEVIQIITKMKRFNGSWNEIPPDKDKTRWEQLESEMEDLLYQWNRLKNSISS